MSPTPHKNVFRELARWMVGLGIVTGLIFPLFVVTLGLPPESVYTLPFFTATLLAGVLVGTVNYLLASRVIRPRVRLLTERMRRIASSIDQATYDNDWSSCSVDACQIGVDTNDELGESAHSFNHLVTALFRSHELEQAVTAFSRTLSTKLELQPLARDALEHLIRYSHAVAGALLVEKEGELVIVATHALKDAQVLAGNDHVRTAARTLEIQHLELPEGVTMDVVLGQSAPREILIIPIEYKEVSVGVVVLASGARFAPNTQRVMGLFGHSLGLALHNALTYDQLQKIAALDPLTGAYNRRFGMDRLHEEYTRAIRSDGTFGLILFDIDHFKNVNDTYGHLAGDRVLVQVGRACRRVMREGDVQVRYGGEEFFLILPGASVRDTTMMAERIRHAVEDTVVRDGDQEIRVTVSCGVTAFPEDDVDSEEQLLSSADGALYESKQGGRNRVTVAVRRSPAHP